MRSRTSFFNPGLAKSLVKRFWPLMLVYLAVLLLSLPLQISSLIGRSWYDERLNYEILCRASEGVVYSALAALFMAMAMFSHLYNRRDCGLINSLPLRRETTWLTACFTGLLPLLLCPVLTWLLSRLLFAGNENISAAALGTWLQSILLANLAFYGLAVFCAMLTGNILAVPALFLALNLAAYGLEGIVRGILDRVVYGYATGTMLFSWLSPLMYMLSNVKASDGLDDFYGPIDSSRVAFAELKGLPALTGYAIAGAVLLMISLLLYCAQHCIRLVMGHSGEYQGEKLFDLRRGRWVIPLCGLAATAASVIIAPNAQSLAFWSERLVPLINLGYALLFVPAVYLIGRARKTL